MAHKERLLGPVKIFNGPKAHIKLLKPKKTMIFHSSFLITMAQNIIFNWSLIHIKIIKAQWEKKLNKTIDRYITQYLMGLWPTLKAHFRQINLQIT